MASLGEVKSKFLGEMQELIFLTLYLMLFFNALSLYHSLIINHNLFTYFHLGYNIFESLLVAKMILIGKILGLGERWKGFPLIITTLYKAAVFSLFVFFLDSMEHFILGLFKGQALDMIWNEFTEQHLVLGLGKVLLAFLFFIPLFSLMELGENRLFQLFFYKK